MHQSNFIIKPLSKYQYHIPSVINALKEEFKYKQGLELLDKDSLETYLKMGTYVMVNTKDEIIGFFSLSRIDSLTLSSIVCQILSFIQSWILGRMLIYDVCILPMYRKKGFGIVMMNLIEHYCLNNCPLVRYLELHTTERKLNYFYKKCGFELSRTNDEISFFIKMI